MHFPSVSVILPRHEKVNEKTTAIKHIRYLFSLVQAYFPLCFCSVPIGAILNLLEGISSNPLGFFYFGKLFGTWQCGTLHLPHTELLYSIYQGLNSTFLSSVPRKFLKILTDTVCVWKETPGLTILWFPLCERSKTHHTTVRGFYIFHTL